MQNYSEVIKRVCLAGPKVLNGIAPTQAALDNFTKAANERDVFHRLRDLARNYNIAFKYPQSPLLGPFVNSHAVDPELFDLDMMPVNVVGAVKGSEYLTFHRGKHKTPRLPCAADHYFLMPIKDIKFDD